MQSDPLPWQWAVEKWYGLLSWQRAADQRWKDMWEQQSSIRIWAGTRLHPDLGAARLSQDLPGPARILMLDCLFIKINCDFFLFKLPVYSCPCVHICLCVSSDGYGDWSQSGCRLDKTEGGRHICKCNHLTNFAILMVRLAQVSSTIKLEKSRCHGWKWKTLPGVGLRGDSSKFTRNSIDRFRSIALFVRWGS